MCILIPFPFPFADIVTEGIFRKCGNEQRVNELCSQVTHAAPVAAGASSSDASTADARKGSVRHLGWAHWRPSGQCVSVHDVACALKRLLADMPHPLLTDALYPLFTILGGLFCCSLLLCITAFMIKWIRASSFSNLIPIFLLDQGPLGIGLP